MKINILSPVRKKKRIPAPYPFLVCVGFRLFTLVLYFTLCQFFHLFRTFSDMFCHAGSSEKPRKLAHRFFFIEQMDPRLHGIIFCFFFDYKMNIRCRRNLGQMSDTYHLPALPDQPQLLRYLSRCDPGYAGINLVKNKGRRILLIRQHGLQSEHDTRELAAGRDITKCFHGLSRI